MAFVSHADYRWSRETVSCPPSTSARSDAVTCGPACRVRPCRSVAPRSHRLVPAAARPQLPAHDAAREVDYVRLLGTRATLERLYRFSELLELWDAAVLPPAVLTVLAVSTDDKPKAPSSDSREKSPDYYANLGDVIRTLREDIPELFQRELNFEIYRDDIVFRDRRNTFSGIKNYKTIFWSLRFHGRIFFSKLYVEVKRIWQPSDNTICMRWTVHGIPRVPWEAEGTFDGISQYKLDSSGKVYEHSVDNVMLRDPPMARSPLLACFNLVPSLQGSPVPGLPAPLLWPLALAALRDDAVELGTAALNGEAEPSLGALPPLAEPCTQPH